MQEEEEPVMTPRKDDEDQKQPVDVDELMALLTEEQVRFPLSLPPPSPSPSFSLV